MITRSNARPTAPVNAIATSIAGNTATRLSKRLSLPVQRVIAPSTLVARKAPSVMKTPWPKFRTSMRPNTSVRPEAMMKMIIPIASPANVSVTHVEKDLTSGSATIARTGIRSSGRRSGRTAGSASGTRAAGEEELIQPPSSLMGRQRQAQKALLQGLVAGKRGHGAGVDDAAAVHHRDAVPDLAREIEILLHEQDRRVGSFELPDGSDHVLDDGGREALARFVDEQDFAGFDDGAGPREHLLPPARQQPRGVLPEALQRRELAEDQLQTPGVGVFGSSGPPGREEKVLAHGEIGEDSHVLGHVRDAAPRDLRRLEGGDVLALEPDRARRDVPQAHDAAQRRRLARAVPAEEHGQLAAGDLEVDAMEDVVRADVRVDALELEERAAHRATSTPR